MQRSENRSYPEWTKIYPKTFPGQVNNDRGHTNYEYTSPARPTVDIWQHDLGFKIRRQRLFERYEADQIDLDGPRDEQPEKTGWKITVTNVMITTDHDLFDSVAVMSHDTFEGKHWLLRDVDGKQLYDRVNEWRYRNQDL
jgi:hypothetical protein